MELIASKTSVNGPAEPSPEGQTSIEAIIKINNSFTDRSAPLMWAAEPDAWHFFVDRSVMTKPIYCTNIGASSVSYSGMGIPASLVEHYENGNPGNAVSSGDALAPGGSEEFIIFTEPVKAAVQPRQVVLAYTAGEYQVTGHVTVTGSTVKREVSPGGAEFTIALLNRDHTSRLKLQDESMCHETG